MDRFTKEKAESCREDLDEIMKSISKNKVGEFIEQFNDIFLFLSAAKEAAPSMK